MGFITRASTILAAFEAKVAAGVAEFSDRLDKPCNQIWLAVMNGRIMGSVAIDGEDLAPGEAHLRWFILDDGCRGRGVGKKLLTEAMRFATAWVFLPCISGHSIN